MVFRYVLCTSSCSLGRLAGILRFYRIYDGGGFCSLVRCLPIVLFVVKATFTFVCLKTLVMSVVSLPTYVNFAHFCFWGCVLQSCFFFFCSLVKRWGSYLLLARICSMIFLCFLGLTGMSLVCCGSI